MKTTIEWTIAAARGRTNPATGRRAPGRRRARGDLGEGVISAAIAVLIMAFLGAAMWVGFQKMWKSTESTTNQKVEQIGSE
jgi:ABC-type Fe3+ transport system permease subunit